MAGQYPIHNKADAIGPSYGRVVRALSNAELLNEYFLKLGDDGYKQAVLEECANRGLIGEDMA